jgi:hypothetical protein
MKKFVLTNLATLCTVFSCAALSDTQNALIDRVATAATDRLIQEIGPRPVRPQK